MRAPGGITCSADTSSGRGRKGTATIAGGDTYCVYDLKYVLSDGETYYKRDLDICQINELPDFRLSPGPWPRLNHHRKLMILLPARACRRQNAAPIYARKPVDPGKSRCS